jgi:hypothetical protein
MSLVRLKERERETVIQKEREPLIERLSEKEGEREREEKWTYVRFFIQKCKKNCGIIKLPFNYISGTAFTTLRCGVTSSKCFQFKMRLVRQPN